MDLEENFYFAYVSDNLQHFLKIDLLTFVTFIFAQGQNYVIHDPEWEIYSVSFLALGR